MKATLIRISHSQCGCTTHQTMYMTREVTGLCGEWTIVESGLCLFLYLTQENRVDLDDRVFRLVGIVIEVCGVL